MCCSSCVQVHVHSLSTNVPAMHTYRHCSTVRSYSACSMLHIVQFQQSCYVIRSLRHGELVLYIYGELLCSLQRCAMVSSCVITKLAWMQICAKLSTCAMAKFAQMHICGMVSSRLIAKLARMQFGAKLSSCVIAKLAWMPTYANMNLYSRRSRRCSTSWFEVV